MRKHVAFVVEVTIFEQYYRPGGVTATIEKDGYQWDSEQLMLEGFGKDEPIGQIPVELGIYDQVSSQIDQRIPKSLGANTNQLYQSVCWAGSKT